MSNIFQSTATERPAYFPKTGVFVAGALFDDRRTFSRRIFVDEQYQITFNVFQLTDRRTFRRPAHLLPAHFPMTGALLAGVLS